ncbi:MAG: MoxR family ATPase [Pontiellaceae bacterium]|nr:MoxR family ATPase [Pontiellaceae bacterium]
MSIPSELSAHEILSRLTANISSIIRGQEKTIRHLLAGFSAGGHILLEDFPGTGKTTLAKTLALSINATFKRIQFTPDLLPSDVVGLSIFDQKAVGFKLHKGPIFTNILLVDEINRTSPRTQSALLEAMAERQVSIDGTLHPLDELFFVIATQNPVETHGTYPLPEAQMDRFALQLSLGYIPEDEEVRILQDQQIVHPIHSLTACVDIADVLALQRQVRAVHIDQDLQHYAVQLVRASRNRTGVAMGASPRASLMLVQTAKAITLLENRTYVTPEDIQEMAVPVMAHRIILESQAKFSGRTQRHIVEEILASTEVPH